MTKSIPLSRAVAPATAAFCACLLAFAGPASAFTPSTKAGGESTPLDLGGAAGATHSTGSGGASIVRTIVGLAIVLAVIWGLAWIMRQVKSAREGGGVRSVERRACERRGADARLRALRAPRARGQRLRAARRHRARRRADPPLHRGAGARRRAAPAGRRRPRAARRALAPELPPARSWRRRPTRAEAQRALPSAHEDGGIPGQSDYAPRSPASRARSRGRTRCGCPRPSSGLLERLREMTVRR